MLAARSTADELMDADDLDAEVYADVVHDLAKVNSWTLARRPTLSFIQGIVAKRQSGSDPIRVLDVGFGDGDMLRAIHAKATAKRWHVDLTGIDLNPRSAPAARAATPSTMDIAWRTGDYADLADQHWDVVISSLVAHHMTHAQLIAFLIFMEKNAKIGWFINDLHRHGLAYVGFPVLARLMGWHQIVRHDGTLSIARSFRPREWRVLLSQANIDSATVRRHFPFRLCVSKTR